MEQTRQTTDRLRVLVVEADPTNLELMRECLAAFDHEVLVAATADEARHHLATQGGDVQMLLTEFSLEQREDGLELARGLRENEQWKALPIIAVTGRAFSSDREKALEAGCDAYLSKPFTLRALSALMSEVYQRGVRMPVQ